MRLRAAALARGAAVHSHGAPGKLADFRFVQTNSWPSCAPAHFGCLQSPSLKPRFCCRLRARGPSLKTALPQDLSFSSNSVVCVRVRYSQISVVRAYTFVSYTNVYDARSTSRQPGRPLHLLLGGRLYTAITERMRITYRLQRTAAVAHEVVAGCCAYRASRAQRVYRTPAPAQRAHAERVWAPAAQRPHLGRQVGGRAHACVLDERGQRSGRWPLLHILHQTWRSGATHRVAKWLVVVRRDCND